jgi:hypothetical protein
MVIFFAWTEGRAVDKATSTFSAMDPWQWTRRGSNPGPSACKADVTPPLTPCPCEQVFFGGCGLLTARALEVEAGCVLSSVARDALEWAVVGSIPTGGFPRKAPSHLLSRSRGGLEDQKACAVGIEPRASLCLTLSGRDAATPRAFFWARETSQRRGVQAPATRGGHARALPRYRALPTLAQRLAATSPSSRLGLRSMADESADGHPGERRAGLADAPVGRQGEAATPCGW